MDAGLLFGRRQDRLVLAMLVLEPHRPESRCELAELLWPAGPHQAWKPAVRGAIGKVLAFLTVAGLPDVIRVDGSYQLRLPDAIDVDLDSAHSAVALRPHADAGNPSEAVRAYRRGAGHWPRS